MKALSAIATGIAPSATLEINALTKRMLEKGIDVLDFGIGEPDFPTPERIKAAGVNAIAHDETRYTASSGTAELKKSICGYVKDQFDLAYKPSQICVSDGAKHVLYAAIMTLCEKGDEVILPAPYWVTYVEMIRMAQATPVIVKTDEESHFKLTPELLRNAVTARTKCLILNNPSNPTGAVYTRKELEEIMAIAGEYDLYVISDEIYHSLVYGTEHISVPSLGDDARERTVLIDGASKSFAMTGWRIGFAAANETIIDAMSNYLGHSTGSPCSISQSACVEAFSGPYTETEEMIRVFRRRRDYMVSRISNMDGVSCLEPNGAFYVFMNIQNLLGKSIFGQTINSSEDFAGCLLENARLAVIPGSAFGADGYVRLSFAVSMDVIREGMDRLEEFLQTEKRKIRLAI